MFRSLINTVSTYGIYDLEIRRYVPTALGRSLGLKQKLVIVRVGEHYGTNWGVDTKETGLSVGVRVFAGIPGYIGLEFELDADGTLHQWLTLPDMAVFGAHAVIKFYPKVEMVTDAELERQAKMANG